MFGSEQLDQMLWEVREGKKSGIYTTWHHYKDEGSSRGGTYYDHDKEIVIDVIRSDYPDTPMIEAGWAKIPNEDFAFATGLNLIPSILMLLLMVFAF